MLKHGLKIYPVDYGCSYIYNHQCNQKLFLNYRYLCFKRDHRHSSFIIDTIPLQFIMIIYKTRFLTLSNNQIEFNFTVLLCHIVNTFQFFLQTTLQQFWSVVRHIKIFLVLILNNN